MSFLYEENPEREMELDKHWGKVCQKLRTEDAVARGENAAPDAPNWLLKKRRRRKTKEEVREGSQQSWD